jgi:hypothetical protein
VPDGGPVPELDSLAAVLSSSCVAEHL